MIRDGGKITLHNQTLIDNIFTNNTVNTNNNYIVISDISDHFPLISFINMLKPNEQTDVGVYRCFSPRNMKLFKDAVDINKLLHITDLTCPQNAYTE